MRDALASVGFGLGLGGVVCLETLVNHLKWKIEMEKQ